MNKTRLAGWAASLGLVAMVWGSAGFAAAAEEIPWAHYARDKAASKYSPADLINRDNVENLELAWSWNVEEAEKDTGKRSRSFKATPLMVNGRLFVSTGLNLVVCLDPATGEMLWSHDPKAYDEPGGAHGGLSSRGIDYWTDGADERILIGTGGLQLVALNAETGETYPDFGDGGEVDLSKGLGREIRRGDYGLNSPVLVVRDTIVVGSIVNDFGQTQLMPPGHVRGYDVRTGEMKWIFHTIPQGEEFGVETWEDEAWKYSGNTNVWSMMSGDDELGYVYLPIGTPTDDHYGGHRLGDNLFAESLVALNVDTGERVWHFQGVHHGVWDYDFPCAPNLVDITVDGRKIKAVAQLSKQGFTYVLDRETGEPVWPIEERPVGASTVPGERVSPTQPFPTKPPAFDRQGMIEENIIDFTPELHAEAMETLKDFVIGPLFTPPIVAGQDGKQAMIQLPGMVGGANWPGGAFDPETSLLYVQSITRPGAMGLSKGNPERSDLAYNRGGARVQGPQGLPIIKPPYGRITAINLNKGDIEWMAPHGDSYRDHPALKDLNLPPLGSSYFSGLAANGPLVTKTLILANQDLPPREGERNERGMMRAFDKATGEVIWENEIATAPISVPMTYVHEDKQYFAFTVGGRGNDMELHAYALP